jgi:hypothetical protein
MTYSTQSNLADMHSSRLGQLVQRYLGLTESIENLSVQQAETLNALASCMPIEESCFLRLHGKSYELYLGHHGLAGYKLQVVPLVDLESFARESA